MNLQETYESSKSQYVAIKVSGIMPWLWFERGKTTFAAGNFTGKSGWGDGGADTEINVDVDNITGFINSQALQYVN